MATNHVRFTLAPRRFHLVAGHGSRRVHIGERALRFFHEQMSGGLRPTGEAVGVVVKVLSLGCDQVLRLGAVCVLIVARGG
jgi:hypothetical protein